jgi:hypothetical protein
MKLETWVGGLVGTGRLGNYIAPIALITPIFEDKRIFEIRI